MGTALAAADVALSRAGASSLAELAARQVPAVLVPYPAAADNHQYFNARAFVQSGAAWMLQQETATAGQLAGEILGSGARHVEAIRHAKALAAWHTPSGGGGNRGENLLGAESGGQSATRCRRQVEGAENGSVELLKR